MTEEFFRNAADILVNYIDAKDGNIVESIQNII